MPIHGLALAAGRPCAYLTSESGARADRSGAARSYLAVHHRHPASRHVSDLCSWPPGRKSVRGIPCLSDQAGWAARASGGQAVRAFAASFWAGEVLVDSGTVGMGPSCLVAASRTAAGFQPERFISADRPARLARCCRPPGIADRLRASRLEKMAYGHKTPCQARIRARIVLLRPGAAPTRGWPGRRACIWTRCARGGVGSPSKACPGWPAASAPVARRRSPRCRPCRSRRWRVGFPPKPGAAVASGRVPGLARGAVQRGVAEAVSSSTVRCWLYQDALKPWQYRCWIFITDPAPGPRLHASSTCTPAPGKARPGRERVRDQRGREGLHPGTLPLPPQPDEMASKRQGP